MKVCRAKTTSDSICDRPAEPGQNFCWIHKSGQKFGVVSEEEAQKNWENVQKCENHSERIRQVSLHEAELSELWPKILSGIGAGILGGSGLLLLKIIVGVNKGYSPIESIISENGLIVFAIGFGFAAIYRLFR